MTTFTNNEKGLHTMIIAFRKNLELIVDFQEFTINLFSKKVLKKEYDSFMTIEDFNSLIKLLEKDSKLTRNPLK